MSCKVSYSEDSQVIEVVLWGKVDEEELNSAAAQCIRLSGSHNCTDFLIDCVEEEETPNVMTLYSRPQVYESAGLSRKSRAGLVLPKSPAARNNALFWETVCRNRGWLVESFVERALAMAWLRRNVETDLPDDEKID